MTVKAIPSGLVALGTHLYYSGEEPFVQATYRDHGCGCRIVGNGTLPHPLAIKWCPEHAAAPELLESLRSTAGILQLALSTDIRPRSETRPVAESAIAEARAVIAKATGGAK